MESKDEPKSGYENTPEWLEALNRAILTSALDCIITMDARGRVLEFNPAAERVFGFSRAEAVGLGLGLAISKAVVEMHAGKIHAESEGLGKGARFIIELPTAARAA